MQICDYLSDNYIMTNRKIPTNYIMTKRNFPKVPLSIGRK